jgi:tRNA(Ile)-lysidine synthase
MNIAERVLRTVRKYGLFSHGGRVVVALSGGPDSVALVHALRELERRGELTLAGVAHFNHQLRGADSDADEAFCRTLAADLGIALEVGRADVRAIAGTERRSLEDAARTLRYAFLDEAVARLSGDAVAVGHSLDDQAETFLLRLLRGSGPRGLAGILPRAGRIVRPLIEIRREELRQYAAFHQLAFRTDPTNADVRIPRNRVRHELIPYLEREFSAGIIEVLAREADVAREDEDRLQREAIDLAVSIVLREEDEQRQVVRVDAGALTSLHPAVAARVARHALEAAAAGGAGQGFIGFDQITRLVAFARDARPGMSLSLPGLQAVRDAEGIVLGAAPSRGPSARVSNSFRFPLSIPGEVTLDNQGWVISADRGLSPFRGLSGDGGGLSAAGDGPLRSAGNLVVPVQAERLTLPLAIRCRAAGDWMRPAGMGGRRKKLQDLFVDRKIPRQKRDSVPLVVDGDDRIVWVVGEALSEEFRVTEPSQGVIFLKARRLGGLG